MLQVCIVFDSGKRYFFPIEILEKYVKPDVIDKIKTEILDQVQKL